MANRMLCGIIFACVFVFVPGGCGNTVENVTTVASGPADKLLFSFESAADIASINKTGLSADQQPSLLLTQSVAHATAGKSCLMITFPPGDTAPGFQLTGFEPDWSKYRRLKVDVYNPSQSLVRLEFRVEDAHTASDKKGSKGVLAWAANLKPGINTYTVELTDAWTFDEMRFFDLKTTRNMRFFLETRPGTTVLYFDNTRLEK